MIRKAETTRCSVVLENEMLNQIDKVAEKTNKTRSEVIRTLIQTSIDKAIFNTPTREIWNEYLKNRK